MSILAGFMVPHPPLIIPEVGKGEEKKIRKTIQCYRRVAEEVARLKPETIVVISPHNVMYEDYFHIRPGGYVSGDFGQFGAKRVQIQCTCDTEFVRETCYEGERQNIPWGTKGGKEKTLDHGTMIPLYFINDCYGDYKLVSVGLSGMSLPLHYRLGQALKSASERTGRRTVVIASGDLSHHLKEEGPYGYTKEGPAYDERIMDVMGRGAFGELFDFSDEFCAKAGECGHRAFTILAGALDGLSVVASRLSYEAPFGVGYGICSYLVDGDNTSRHFLQSLQEREREEKRRQGEDDYVTLARLTLETYLRTGKLPELTEEWKEKEYLFGRKAGVFVSLSKHGRLRGCIGTILPTRENVALEIMENAINAALQDTRFEPVTEDELPYLGYSVDILEMPEKVVSLRELDVRKYGVIVTKGRKRGLLLPDLDGVDTVEDQIAIAKQKAGIRVSDRDVVLERFKVTRYGEKS
ncbi:MAG: AmmeMemoRadiSam system protein A [Lachnospiraceae bacterium]|nr:AmmeMemoRadiSam system protein A [Lachnospiraceae bacterium]